MPFQVIKHIDFCYGHRLLNYAGKCRNLHGHNGRVEIVLQGDELDELDMLVDFSEVKRTVKGWIDTELDHKMVLNRQDPLIPLLEEYKQPLYLMDCNPTAEALAREICRVAREHDFPVSEVRFWESPSSTAVYRVE